MTKRAKLTDRQKKKIILDYVETQNYSEAARRNKTSATTVKRIVDTNKTTLKKVEHKKEQNTEDILAYLNSQNETVKRVLGKVLFNIEKKVDKADDNESLRDLTTTYGVMVDKAVRLAEVDRGRNPSPTKDNDALSKSLMDLAKELDGDPDAN